MSQYLPSKGDLIRIKQVPYWIKGDILGGYDSSGDRYHQGLLGQIVEVSDPYDFFPDKFTIKDNKGRKIGPVFPNDPDYFEIVFTK